MSARHGQGKKMYSGRSSCLNNVILKNHTYIPTYLRTYVPTYLRICVPTYLHTTYLKTAVSGKDTAPVVPAAQGAKWVKVPPPHKVQNIKICSAFSETEYRSSDRRQYSDTSGSDFANNCRETTAIELPADPVRLSAPLPAAVLN